MFWQLDITHYDSNITKRMYILCNIIIIYRLFVQHYRPIIPQQRDFKSLGTIKKNKQPFG